MNYELAKKLKDAGFQQEGEGYDSELLDSSRRSGVNVFRENVYYPTLSELIEACGHVKLEYFPKTNSVWANCCDRKDHEQHGSTPEEAVANLYLSLYNKGHETKTNKNTESNLPDNPLVS